MAKINFVYLDIFAIILKQLYVLHLENDIFTTWVLTNMYKIDFQIHKINFAIDPQKAYFYVKVNLELWAIPLSKTRTCRSIWTKCENVLMIASYLYL